MANAAASVLRRANALLSGIARLTDAVTARHGDASAALDRLRDEAAAVQLVAMPVERLREVTDERLRIAPLRDAGYATVFDVLRASQAQLDAVPNVGEASAAQLQAAAEQIARAVRRSVVLRPDPDRPTDTATAALAEVDRYDRLRRATAAVRREAGTARTDLEPLVRAARPARSRARLLFTFGAKKRDALDAVERLRAYLDTPEAAAFAGRLTEADAAVGESAHPRAAAELWRDYERNAAAFTAAVEQVGRGGAVDGAPGPVVPSSYGFVPLEIVERIAAFDLDESYLRVTLRGYQEFGAKFALVQGRTILGDEMGLGKTIQAIAAMAHLQAQGHAHFLVVCPATVLVNWEHEVGRHSDLVACRIHGDARDDVLATWRRDGGVGVTTFETLRSLELPHDAPIALLVVDEAHYVKNAESRRSRAVQAVVARSERVLFMSGTPMENRVDEFRTLVSYLRPEVARTLHRAVGVAGADAFRRDVAPVYLRRNQDDVLSELPERIDTEDWVTFTADDLTAYRDAVATGNLMAMRRAAFASRDPERSAKLGRLADIVDDARENGHKVVVFSFFLDVLDAVRELVGAAAHGPLTGATSPIERQALVDRFSAVEGHAVLVSQIQAGGVGLNVQAASIVVLTEPQWKPSTEEQAIARCHRMGQTRVVQVHRLLAERSVDSLLLDVVRRKSALFDDYARESALKDASADAIDAAASADAIDAAASADAVVEEAAREIVATEQARLGAG
jgi:SNF2 family DNA or RNA helicase